MSAQLVFLIGICVMFGLLAIGTPIWISMGVSFLVGYTLATGAARALAVLSLGPWQILYHYELTVVPMFVVMGIIAGECGFGADAYYVLRRWIGKIKGSLAIATTLGCAAFGTLSGDATSTIITIGKIAIPEMDKAGYKPSLSLASLAAAGPIAAMIPPSLLIVFYSIVTGVSAGKLLMAGFLPGILNALIISLIIFLHVTWKPAIAPISPSFSWKERWSSLPKVLPIAACALTVIGGMYSGMFTPTEAGAMGALVISIMGFAMRRLTLRKLLKSIVETTRIMGIMMAIMVGAYLFSYMVNVSGAIPQLLGFVTSKNITPMELMLVVVFVYLVLGCFMQAWAMIVLTMPFFMPLMMAAHIDPIWAGIIIVQMCEIGCITPPFGISLFSVKLVKPEVSTTTIIAGIAPMLLAEALTIALLLLFPKSLQSYPP